MGRKGLTNQNETPGFSSFDERDMGMDKKPMF